MLDSVWNRLPRYVQKGLVELVVLVIVAGYGYITSDNELSIGAMGLYIANQVRRGLRDMIIGIPPN